MPPHPASAPIAVIDIGSNSIKTLVAHRLPEGQLAALLNKTLDCRISTGLGASTPRLSEAGMANGLAAIQQLLDLVAPFAPAQIALVATSAVRDAENRTQFLAQVQDTTHHPIRILTGEEEANFIGLGLTADPALTHLRDFYVFDLGGGSLECLTFHSRQITQAISLPLGCVRLTEKFITDPTAPIPPDAALGLALHVKEELRRAGFRFDLPAPATAVFTGGTMTTIRQLRAAKDGVALLDTSSAIATSTLLNLLHAIAPLDLSARLALPGMPAARADVFPAALITALAVVESAELTHFHHSLYNLRWGLATELLAAPPTNI
jgi:exopolyphosphatase / guanosine-5'-triphosphate,3'-diphosphate pyrophosphatase